MSPRDAETLVREALAARRAGDVAGSWPLLEEAVSLSPEDELARALRLVTLVDLGRAPETGLDLSRELPWSALDRLALEALDLGRGAPDRDLVARLLSHASTPGAMAIVGALDRQLERADRGDEAVVLLAEWSRELADHRRAFASFERIGRAAVERIASSEARLRRAAALVSGTLGVMTARPSLERLLAEGEDLHDRAAAATGLAYLLAEGARAILVAAIGRATTKVERAAYLRAIEEIGD